MDYYNVPVQVRFINSETFTRLGKVISIVDDIGIEFLEDDTETTMLIPWTSIAFMKKLTSKEETCTLEK